nr:MAG TPA: hypothetical protein [Caudoviricetes sp.]
MAPRTSSCKSFQNTKSPHNLCRLISPKTP